jgi:predicted PurR-regulated permease PerM
MPRRRALRPEIRLALAIAAAGAVLFLAWRGANSLFLIFAGLLVAVFLDACTAALGRIWHTSRAWRLAAVTVTLLLLGAGGIAVGGYALVRQADELADTVQDQLRALRGELSDRGLLASEDAARESAPSDEREPLVRSFLPDPGALARSVGSAFGVLFGGIGNLIVILFLGIYVAADPGLYRRAALLVFPDDRRDRAGAVLDEMAGALRAWMVGQLVSMAIIAALSLVGLLLIGMPGAFVLSLQIGVFGFIPYLGAFLGGTVIMLAALGQGTAMALWAFAVYLVVQATETYLVTPFVQRRSAQIAPAFAIGGGVLLGTIFGIWGLALAAPILAALRVVFVRL